MPPLYYVPPDQLYAAGVHTQNISEQVQGLIQQGLNTVEQLLAEGALGADIDMLHQVTAHWTTDSHKLNQVLTTIADGLKGTAVNYSNNMHVNRANVANVGASLPAAKF